VGFRVCTDLATHAARTYEPRVSILRVLDLVVLGLALPLFVVADLPLGGWAAGAGAWVVQRAVQTLVHRRARASDDPRTVVGLTTASMIARGWLVALTIFLVGLGNPDAGLAAAVLVIIVFTVYFTVSLALRPFDAGGGR
jgi:hypothetical protein